MKKIIMLVALATITACKPAAKADAPATAPATAPIAADGGPSAGLYRATDASGTVLIENLRPDGSYVFMDQNRSVLEEGRWTQKSPAELCFIANTENAPEACYREDIRPNGIWYSTNATTNETAIIERIER